MSKTHWCRIEIEGKVYLGYLEGKRIVLCEGELFDHPTSTGISVDIDGVTWLPPVEPRQFLGLWNNFYERQKFEKTKIPDFPLFFSSSSSEDPFRLLSAPSPDHLAIQGRSSLKPN